MPPNSAMPTFAARPASWYAACTACDVCISTLRYDAYVRISSSPSHGSRLAKQPITDPPNNIQAASFGYD